MNIYIFIIVILLLQLILFFYYNKKINKSNKELERLRLEGETRYKDLANLLPQLVVELDENGRFNFINDSGIDFIGYSKFDIKNGLKIFDIIHPEDKEKFNEEFLYLLEGGVNKGQEFRILTKDNKTLFVVLFLKVMDSNEYLKRGLRGFIIDITDRKKLERKVLSAVIETEDKERRRFSEDLHDGLGPLLSTIKLYINQMMSGKVTQAEEQELFAYANELLDESISTTRNIANNILPGSIVDNGLIPVVSSFCHHIEKTGSLKVLFSYNVEKRLDINLELNIYRIIIELINNSIKHAYASKIDISIIIEDNRFALQYSDNGVGFDFNLVKHGLGLDNIINRAQSLNADFQFKKADKGMLFNLEVDISQKQEQNINVDNNISDNYGQ